MFAPALSLIIESVTRALSPRINATAAGGLVLHWEQPSRELEVEILPSGGFSVFFSDEETGEEVDPPEPVTAAEAKDLLCRYSQA
jgi:hypothetical protein